MKRLLIFSILVNKCFLCHFVCSALINGKNTSIFFSLFMLFYNSRCCLVEYRSYFRQNLRSCFIVYTTLKIFDNMIDVPNDSRPIVYKISGADLGERFNFWRKHCNEFRSLLIDGTYKFCLNIFIMFFRLDLGGGSLKSPSLDPPLHKMFLKLNLQQPSLIKLP